MHTKKSYLFFHYTQTYAEPFFYFYIKDLNKINFSLLKQFLLKLQFTFKKTF